VLLITLRVPPSMDTAGEQSQSCTLINAQRRKIERNKTRLRRGNVQRKRLHVLQNLSKLAFSGWKEVPEPWIYADCEEYIEWCHIDKKFPPEWHRKTRKSNKANLRFCSCLDFIPQCIEVYQVLYGHANMERNEVVLYICQMV
jgi:endo-1,4-beta-D-glucanase Y